MNGVDGTNAPDMIVRPTCKPGCHTCSNHKYCNSKDERGYNCGEDKKGSKGTDGGRGGNGGIGGDSGDFGSFKK